MPEWTGVAVGMTVGSLLTATVIYLHTKREETVITVKETKKKGKNSTATNDIHHHCNQKIQAERVGRINAEKALRAGVVEKICDPKVGYPLLVIGTVSSPYLARRGTPRQGLLVPDSRTLITLSKEIPSETLEGLEGYSHLFVQFLFHENTNLVKTVLAPSSSEGESKALNSRAFAAKSSTFTNRVHSFAARVLPPLLQGGSIGLFATRSPHRPNALGLSLVKIVKVDPQAKTVLVSGADLVHGTPVVDLKPWGPFDCPTCIHNVVDHDGIQPCGRDGPRCGQFDARVPDWVAHGLSHPYKLAVEWTEESKSNLSQFVSEGKSTFYSADEAHLVIDAIDQILSLDIRSVHRGRGGGAVSGDGRATDLIGDRIRDTKDGIVQEYEVEYDIFHIDFVIQNGNNPKYLDEPWIMIRHVGLIPG